MWLKLMKETEQVGFAPVNTIPRRKAYLEEYHFLLHKLRLFLLLRPLILESQQVRLNCNLISAYPHHPWLAQEFPVAQHCTHLATTPGGRF